MLRKEKKITQKQLDTLNALKAYRVKNGNSPTLRELAEILGVRSVQTVADRLEGLRKKGLITKQPHSWRSVDLDEKSNRFIDVGVTTTAGADQVNVFAQEEFDTFLRVEEKVLKGHREVFAVRVMGNSMRDAGIYDGGYVFVDDNPNYQPANGDLVVASLRDSDWMTVVKEYYQSGDLIELRPKSDDPRYHPIVLGVDAEDMQILGKVINWLNAAPPAEDDVTFESIKDNY